MRRDEIARRLEDPAIWKRPEAAELGREKAQLERTLERIDGLRRRLDENRELLELAEQEKDAEVVDGAGADLETLAGEVAAFEFLRMFAGEMDSHNAFLDVTAGSGGTEAQDWAEMLLRMYLRWAESRGFKAEMIEASAGEVAGVKSATVKICGEYAYGWLRTETGVHRLVRKSPFDSGNRRHTSFAAVFVSPEVEDDIEIDLKPEELRIDVYRASGAGGQHVNKTESAVRITHLPTATVVQCQNQRSQHKNRETAIKQIKAKLYELEMRKRKGERDEIEASKDAIGWGSQIRSYVLDQSRIKDLRTQVEVGDTQSVLDGKLDPFMEESLKRGL